MLNNPYINNTRKVCESVTATQNTDNVYTVAGLQWFFKKISKID